MAAPKLSNKETNIEVFTLVGKIVLEGKEKLTSDLKVVTEEAKRTNSEFRSFVQSTRSVGMSMVGIGAAGLVAAKATENWNNALGDTLQALKPVFTILTAVGGILLTLPSIIRGVVVAFNTMKVAMQLLQAQAIATQAAFGLLTIGLSMIAAGIGLLATHSRHVEEVTAQTERWGDTLGRTNDRLKELKAAGLGASEEAQNLRKVMDDLIKTYDVYNTIGEDNVVTIYNQADAEEKLAEAKVILTNLEDQLIGRQTDANRSTEIGKQQTENIEASIGNYKNTIVELTLGILELKDAQEKETQALLDNADAIRDSAISDLESLYGLRANASLSLIDQFEDETDARRESLNDQLDAVKDSTSSIIAQYRKEYDEKVKLLDKVLDQMTETIQEQIDALDKLGEKEQENADADIAALRVKIGLLDAEKAAEDQTAKEIADAKTEAELRAATTYTDVTKRSELEAAVASEWAQKGKAEAEAELTKFLNSEADARAEAQTKLADFLEGQARELADRQRDEAKSVLETQIEAIQTTQTASDVAREAEKNGLQEQLDAARENINQIKDLWQEELDANIDVQDAILFATETTIQSQLTSLQNAMIAKRSILQQELNDAVSVQNQIRDNAIADINTVISTNLGTNPQVQTALSNIKTTTAAAIGTMFSRLHLNGMANGGAILEPTLLSSLRTGRPYAVAGESGPEYVSPGGGGKVELHIHNPSIRSDIDIVKLTKQIEHTLYQNKILRGNYGT